MIGFWDKNRDQILRDADRAHPRPTLSETAKKIGNGCTKNMVAGRRNRLGLSRRKSKRGKQRQTAKRGK